MGTALYSKPAHLDLRDAERLERQAACERVLYYIARGGEGGGRVLDIGCGNGYAVMEWRSRGRAAFGVDNHFYRLGRWADEYRSRRPLVVADAQWLPFRDAAFSVVVSSGMLEHVGVTEYGSPYRFVESAEKDEARRAVIAEMIRVAGVQSCVFLDFPNGTFPIDCFHGDGLVSFRVHRIPDRLLPSFNQVRAWAKTLRWTASVEPLRGRLALRRIGGSWWGRLLAGPMRLYLAGLDGLPRSWFGTPLSALLPFLVVRLRPDEPTRR